MFIDLTRHGGDRALRVVAGAIAYLDVCEGGTAVHLIGGETLRVHEDIAQIEAAAVPQVVGTELVAATPLTIAEFVEAYRLLVVSAAAPHGDEPDAAAILADSSLPAPVLKPVSPRKGR